MGKTIWILSPEDYKAYAAAHPEKIQAIEDTNYYGLTFKESKPVTENRAARRKKEKTGR